MCHMLVNLEVLDMSRRRISRLSWSRRKALDYRSLGRGFAPRSMSGTPMSGTPMSGSWVRPPAYVWDAYVWDAYVWVVGSPPVHVWDAYVWDAYVWVVGSPPGLCLGRLCLGRGFAPGPCLGRLCLGRLCLDRGFAPRPMSVTPMSGSWVRPPAYVWDAYVWVVGSPPGLCLGRLYLGRLCLGRLCLGRGFAPRPMSGTPMSGTPMSGSWVRPPAYVWDACHNASFMSRRLVHPV